MHHREPRTPVIAACLTANFGKVILIASMYGLFILHLPYNITQMSVDLPYMDGNHGSYTVNLWCQKKTWCQTKKNISTSTLTLQYPSRHPSKNHQVCGTVSFSTFVPSRKLTYPTWGKGKSSTQKCWLGRGYVRSLEGTCTVNKYIYV